MEQYSEELNVKLSSITTLKFKRDYTYDKPYYDAIEMQVMHIIHKWNLDLLTHRQLVYTSLDCISCIHILNEDDHLIMNVYQRSCHKKSYKHDRNFLFELGNKVAIKLDKKFTILNWTIGSLHQWLQQ